MFGTRSVFQVACESIEVIHARSVLAMNSKSGTQGDVVSVHTVRAAILFFSLDHGSDMREGGRAQERRAGPLCLSAT